MSPNTRLMFAPFEQLWRLAHSVCPSMAQACSMVRLPPPSAPRFEDTFPQATAETPATTIANSEVANGQERLAIMICVPAATMRRRTLRRNAEGPQQLGRTVRCVVTDDAERDRRRLRL